MARRTGSSSRYRENAPVYAKLATLLMNVVRVDNNRQTRFKLEALLKFRNDQNAEKEDSGAQAERSTPHPDQYTWPALVQFLQKEVGFEPSVHRLAQSRIVFDLQKITGPYEVLTSVDSEQTWSQLLWSIVHDNNVRRTDSIFLLVQARELPQQIGIEDLTLQLSTITTSETLPVIPAFEPPEDDDSDLTVPYVPDLPTLSEEGDEEHLQVTDDEAPSPKAQAAQLFRPASRSSSVAGRSSRQSSPGRFSRQASPAPRASRFQPPVKLELIDDKTEYETENAQDDDYGAIDLSVIDTYVGSYNTGDSDKAWARCLDFFKINPAEYNRQEAIKNEGARKRVPMKKLPGMTVGLFDYQLIGVLNMLKLVSRDVSGGLLADEQGLGKTQEMFGAIALAYNLRRSKTEVKAAWRAGKLGLHNAQGADARSCPADDRYGFRCYCYNRSTQKLADLLPEGLNLIVAPGRNCMQIFREAKSKLDVKVLKLRIEHPSADKEDKLTPSEIKALSGTVTATADGDDGEVRYSYHPNVGQSDYIIVCPPDSINKLAMGAFSVNVKLPDGTTKKKSGFMPGMILMDEFHEYTAPTEDSQDSRTVTWLKYMKETRHPAPLAYFVSGTPFGDSPADIRPAVEIFERPIWNESDSHFMAGASLASFDELIATFVTLTTQQNNGEAVPMEKIADYRQKLHIFLRGMVVRRLGVDKFRGRNLTDIGPLSVGITDHPLPEALTQSLQDLSNQTRNLVQPHLADGTSLGQLLRSNQGESLLLKLRLASTFPGTSTPLPDLETPFTFTDSEIVTHLAAAKGDLTKTPYFRHIPTWARHSPKLDTISKTIEAMLTDRSKIPGETTTAKKLILFSPLEAESMLLYGYLLLRKQSDKRIKPVRINATSTMTQADRQKVIDKFLEMGNAPPNILVAPMSLAGTGLNLQAAKYSVVTSPAWCKRDNQQAYYRTHRVGQRQETKLCLLTARWNPAERVVLRKYEGLEVDGDDEEDVWGVGSQFGKGCEGGLVDRHQQQEGDYTSSEE